MKNSDTEKITVSEKTSGMTVLSSACMAMTVLAALLLYFSNVKIPFMMDDLWYSTDLRDGSALDGIGDVFGSQVWHYLNWGGRVFTHGFLQLSLMCGEKAADIINTAATLLLAAMVCCAARHSSDSTDPGKNLSERASAFALAFGLLITCCPNFRMSMLWQAGCANYVYSSVWILFFHICYLRALDPEKKDLRAFPFFMPFLGLITGWSTENMGPSSCIAAALITFACIKKGTVSRAKKVWMIEGVISSFIGSVFCILAPGNFVRKTDSADDLALTLPDRLIQMLRGAGSYMFLSLIVLAGALIAYRIHVNKKLSAGNSILLIAAFLSYGAMIASPHYPDRAAFGTCILLEAVSVSLLGEVFKAKRSAAGYALSILLLVSSAAVMYMILV